MQNRYANEFYNAPVIGAILLFAINNWWLKIEYGNWFTGKLSDFLFCFFFPIYCSSLLAIISTLEKQVRIGIGVALTLLSFIAMKISIIVSSWVSEILSALTASVIGMNSVNAVDPTDLIACPMVIISILFVLKKVT